MNLNKLLINLIKNKKILILGLGREGFSSLKRLLSLSDKEFYFSKLSVADMSETVEAKVDDLSKLYNINILKHLGKDYLSQLSNYDVIFKAPGIKLEKNLYNKNKEKITSQLQCFLDAYREQTIGITGTKGKSTTTSIIYQLLKLNNIDTVIGGNIGIPVFDLSINENTIAVVEMSCHQLEYIKESPHISILLNIHPEHLDHYETYENYIKAKLNIIKYQNSNDYAIVNNHNIEFPTIKNSSSNIITASYENESDISVIDKNRILIDNKILSVNNLKLKGIHNLYNLGIAIKACELAKIKFDNNFIIEALPKLSSLPHRLELFKTYNNISFYDDSISTIGETTIRAVKSIDDAGIVIIGGMDRGIPYDDLEDFILRSPKYDFILMYDTGKRIYNNLQDKCNNIFLCSDLENATALSYEFANKRLKYSASVSVILSPAAASYDSFKNFEERGNIFQEYINRLILRNNQRSNND